MPNIDELGPLTPLALDSKLVGAFSGATDLGRFTLAELLAMIAANIGTAYTRTLLDDADAAAARNTLGLTHRTLAQSGTPVSHTGTTAETVLATVAVPSMAAGDMLRIVHGWGWTNSANTKTPRVRFGGAGGAVYHGGLNYTTTTFMLAETIIFADTTGAQRGSPVSIATSFGTSTGAEVTSALNTAVSQDLVLSMTLNSAAETAFLKFYSVELVRKPF